jgi:hypothetical protein
MENTLNIQITLNDEQLKNLITGNINDLPKEKLQDILLQAIKEILTSDRGQKLFIESDGYYNSRVTPSYYLKDLVQKADIKEAISPIVNQAVAEFAANYPDILERCLKSSITEMFMSQFNHHQLQVAWDAVMNKGDN